MTALPTFILAQINPVVGDLGYNFGKISDVWAEHDANDTIIVFPELVTCGYPPEDLVLKSFFMERIEAHIDDLLIQSKKHKSWVTLPTPHRESGKLYNAAHLIGDGQIQDTVLKHCLPNEDVFDEKRIFTPGPLPKPVTYKGTKLGLMICEDMWWPEPAAALKEAGSEILIVPNGSPFDANKQNQRYDLARERISETGLPLIYLNQVGGQDELVFDGASFVMDAQGTITYEAPQFEESITASDSPSSSQKLGEEETLYKALILGLHDYVVKNNFPGVLIGLSGGIDSALSAAIAVDALGADKVRCIMMPSPYTSKDSLEDAKECAALLGVSYESISIEPAMEAFTQMLPDLSGTAHENMQSRARGLTLMALSNSTGHMVLSTGNKSEMAVGYATLYGDMCGGFNALKDLYKMQVYALSKWRNTKSAVIPERIITKAPSAELKPDQADQDSLPPYETLDDILECLIEHDMGLSDITARGHDLETVKRVWTLLDRAEYKRRQAPPGVKVTTKAFGKDRRYPITNGFTGNIEKA